MKNFTGEDITAPYDFINGQRDCREGTPHQNGRSFDYDRGYSAQYDLEQIKTVWSDEEREMT